MSCRSCAMCGRAWGHLRNAWVCVSRMAVCVCVCVGVLGVVWQTGQWGDMGVSLLCFSRRLARSTLVGRRRSQSFWWKIFIRCGHDELFNFQWGWSDRRWSRPSCFSVLSCVSWDVSYICLIAVVMDFSTMCPSVMRGNVSSPVVGVGWGVSTCASSASWSAMASVSLRWRRPGLVVCLCSR